MAQEEGRDPGPQREDLGHSFEAHSGNVGSAFAERNSSPEIKKKPHTTLWILLIVAALLGVFLVYTFTKPSGGNQASLLGGRGQMGPSAITAGSSTTGSMDEYVEALGTVTPVTTITLYSQITGIVMSVHYKEGQIVHKGEPLVDIDPRPYQAQLTAAIGQLEHDQGMLDEARMDLARYQNAWARNAIAKQTLDDQAKTVIQDEGTVKADQGTVAYDKVELLYCHITSPIDGRVGLRLVDPGNTVFSGTGSTLVVITQLSPITVVFDVSEDDLPKVEAQLKGNRVMKVDAYDRSDENKLESGTLTALDNEIDTTTGTVKFRATFPNKAMQLFPNQFVNAHLLVTTLTNATLAPTAAVQYNGTAAFVYIVNPNNTVSAQPVQPITGNDRLTAVTGIGSGVLLATSGFDRLENGTAVQIHQIKRKSSSTTTGMGPSAGGSTTP